MNDKPNHRIFQSIGFAGSVLLFFTGFVLECCILLPLFHSFTLWQITFNKLIAGHIIANIILAWALLELMPPKYRIRKFNSIFFFFTFGFFIPLLADIGFVMVLVFGIQKEKNADDANRFWRVTQKMLLPNRAPDIDTKLKFGDHGMLSRLQNSVNVKEHLGIVLATRCMRDNNAVPLLQTALKSPQDDVRLLAFSLLEKRNAEINTYIEKLQKILKRKNKKSKIHVSIAQNHLRLVTLELIQDEMKDQALNKARQHLQEALAEDEIDRNVHFTLGQVLLEQGATEQAHLAFEKALELGFSPTDVYPFLARIAHMRRQFQKVPEYLQKIPNEYLQFPPLVDITSFWIGKNNSNHFSRFL